MAAFEIGSCFLLEAHDLFAEMDGSREAAVTTNDALISFSPVLSGIS